MTHQFARIEPGWPTVPTSARPFVIVIAIGAALMVVRTTTTTMVITTTTTSSADVVIKVLPVVLKATTATVVIVVVVVRVINSKTQAGSGGKSTVIPLRTKLSCVVHVLQVLARVSRPLVATSCEAAQQLRRGRRSGTLRSTVLAGVDQRGTKDAIGVGRVRRVLDDKHVTLTLPGKGKLQIA